MSVDVGDRVEVYCVNHMYGELLYNESKLTPVQRRGVVISCPEHDSWFLRFHFSVIADFFLIKPTGWSKVF